MIQLNNIPKLGQASKEWVVIQEQLNDVGGFELREDGIPGPKTLAALKNFQRSKIPGSSGTGQIGPKTLKLLGIEVVAKDPVSGKNPLTVKLPGTGRTLHPTMRLMLEKAIAPNGTWPDAFIHRDHKKMVVLVAKALESFEIKEEGGSNKGEEVGFIQSIIGGDAPMGNSDAWCMSTDQCIIAFVEDYSRVKSDIPASEGVTDTWSKAPSNLKIYKAIAGSFYLGQHGKSWQGHTGTVIEPLGDGTMRTIEGNYGNKLQYRNPDQDQNGDLKTLGFLIMYTENIIPKQAA